MIDRFSATFILLIVLASSPLFGAPKYNLPDTHPNGVNQNDSDYTDGFINVVTQYGAVPNNPSVAGTNTTKIQNAINAAQQHGRATYFPSGTYYVNGSLNCYQRLKAVDKADKSKGFVLVGSKYGGASVIRLEDSQPNFQTETHNGCNAVVNIWSESSYSKTDTDPVHKGRAGLCYGHSLRHLTIDTGGNNPGAVGVRFAGAQGSALQSITVNAYGSYAGIYNLPGQAGGLFDSTVNGGKYGVLLPHYNETESGVKDGTSGPTINGCIFNDQRENAVRLTAASPMLMVGFKIVNSVSTKPAIYFRNGNSINVIDGSIEYVGGTDNAAIDNSNRMVYLKDVYVKRANKIVKNTNADYNNPGANTWTLVSEYIKIGSGSERYRNGSKKTQDWINDTSPVSDSVVNAAVAGFFDTHIWDSLPSREDPGVIFLNPNGGNDTNQINNALASSVGANVFLRRGTYRISNTIELGKDDVLMGVSRLHTLIRTHNNWNTNVAQKPMVQTTNDKNSKAVLAFLGIQDDKTSNHPNVTYIRWRAGANSMAHDVWCIGIGGGGKRNLKHYRHIIEGYGGGRWSTFSGIMTEMRAKHPDTACYVVQNTTEVLRMYAMNTEHLAYSKNGQVRFDNASNVYLYQFKFEAGAPGIPLFSSSVGTNHANYAVPGSGDVGKKLDWQAIPIKIIGGTNVNIFTARGFGAGYDNSLPVVINLGAENSTITSVTQYGGNGSGKRLREEYPVGTVAINTGVDVVALQRNVAPNTAPSVSPIADISMAEGGVSQVNLSGSDPENNPILFIVSGLPVWASLVDNGDGTGMLAFAPDYSVGPDSFNISVSVEDSLGLESSVEPFTLTVSDVPGGAIAYRNDFSSGVVSDDFVGDLDGFFIGGGQLINLDCDVWQSISLNEVDFPAESDNYKIVAKMRTDGASWSTAGIRFRDIDSQHWCELNVQNDPGDDIRVFEKNGANPVAVASWDVDNDTRLGNNVYSLVVVGSNVSVYLGNQYIGNAVVNNLSGKVGIRQRGGDVWGDYFRVISNSEPDYLENFDDGLAQDWNYNDTLFQVLPLGGGDSVIAQSSGSYHFVRYSKTVSVDANYRFSVKGRAVGTRVNHFDSPIAVVKYKDTDNWITLYVVENVNSAVKDIVLKKKVGGGTASVETIASNISSLASVSNWHVIEVQVDSDKLKVGINGITEVPEFVDPDLNAPIFDEATECGVRSGASTVSVEYNDFMFYDEYDQ